MTALSLAEVSQKYDDTVLLSFWFVILTCLFKVHFASKASLLAVLSSIVYHKNTLKFIWIFDKVLTVDYFAVYQLLANITYFSFFMNHYQ